jgi:dihydropteroate synthase
MTFNPFTKHQWKLAHERQLDLGPDAVIMGILNVTPDSFSDGGRYDQLETAIEAARLMIKAGATIIDIGGESTRPGAVPIDAEEEKRRVLPIVRALKRHDDVVISIDTYRAETAHAAIGEGADIINDVWGLQKDPDMARTVADMGAGVVIMHSGRERDVLDDVIEDQKLFLNRALGIALDAGIAREAIVLDPGIGFAKGMAENIALLNRFEELQQFGYPLLIGTSRKRFLGAITGQEDSTRRDVATAATSVVARMKGAAIFRVHDVAINKDALQVADALLNQNGNRNV